MGPREILLLASVYRRNTGRSFRQIGWRSCRNNQFLQRLAEGKGCHTRTIERAEAWFTANWPPDVPWPLDGTSAYTRPGGTGGAHAGGLACSEPPGRDCAP